MPELLRYLDKRPTHSFSLGPSGKGVVQSGFFDYWRGWYVEGEGIHYVKESEYVTPNPTGHFASGSTDILLADSLSISFDSKSNLWAAVNSNESISVFQFSGAGYIHHSSFSGKSPALFNTFVFNSGFNETTCFYLKNKNAICFRRSSESFNTERLLYSGSESLVRLNNAIKNPLTGVYFRVGVLATNSQSDSLLFMSDKFDPPLLQYFQNFSSQKSGVIDTLTMWEIEQPVSVFINGCDFHSDDFSVSPSGTITSTSGLNNMQGGFFING